MAIPPEEYAGRVHHGVFYLPNLSRWILLALVVLILVVVAGLAYTVHEWRKGQQMAATNSQLGIELNQTRQQLAAVTAKVDALTQPLTLEPVVPGDEAWSVTPPQQPLRAEAVPTAKRPRRPVMTKWQKQMQQRLVKQEQEISATKQDIQRTQADLQSKMASTHGALNDLSGTIARNHVELVALERLGERNYYEFDLDKSKHFQKEGSIGISLRHTSTKHQNYDVMLLVDDTALTKKHVNLYEPLMFETRESPQPLQLVVNRIGKNHIHGYVSEPKSMTERTAVVAEPTGMATSETASTAAATQPAAAPASSAPSLTH